MATPLMQLLNAPGCDEAWFEGLLRWLVGTGSGVAEFARRTERLAALTHILQEHGAGPGYLHPFKSWTLPFAALTGVFLWISSLDAGWASNWSASRRLPEALATHRRLVKWVGPASSARIGGLVEHHLSGVVGYIVLGFLLGFMPVVFVFMGLPVEVRHVTLSAASLGLCAATDLQAGLQPWQAWLWALAGIAGIGVLNFGVSFLLALRTALGARGIDESGRAGLRRRLWIAFRRNPWRFIGPPEKP